MEIVRNPDGTLVVPVEPAECTATTPRQVTTQSRRRPPRARACLHPGEGGYDEALAEWDRQQNPDAELPVSTASGREEAMHVVHEVAESPKHEVEPAIEALDDPEALAKPCDTCSSEAYTRWRTSRTRWPRQKAESHSAPTRHEDHRRGPRGARLNA